MSDLPALSDRQNPDGGWPYRNGGSWTEPTVFAMLALASAGEVSSPATVKALHWLRTSQRSDGGWPPRPSVEESTWVTALVLLLPAPMLTNFNAEVALDWLLSKTGRESSWVHRLRAAMISGRVDPSTPEGWPWFPDTAAWVTPTALGIMALRKAGKRDQHPEIQNRIQQGQEFLMSRVCIDGGWNHGSTRALGYDGLSYPETTGLALAALGGWPEERLARSLDRAEQHLLASRSVEATCWLQLGLLSHHRPPAEPLPAWQRPLATQEIALAAIVRAALNGNHILVN